MRDGDGVDRRIFEGRDKGAAHPRHGHQKPPCSATPVYVIGHGLPDLILIAVHRAWNPRPPPVGYLLVRGGDRPMVRDGGGVTWRATHAAACTRSSIRCQRRSL